jgi:hypothetical protein
MGQNRRSRPEDLACARLDGISLRHAREGTDLGVALAELRAVPAVTPEHMAESAGIMLGYSRNDQDYVVRMTAAALVIAAGADISRLRYWIKEGAARRAMPQHAAR